MTKRAHQDKIIQWSKLNTITVGTLNSYLVIFIAKYVINTNDTTFISIVTMVSTLTMLLTRNIVNRDSVRRKVDTASKLMGWSIVDSFACAGLIVLATPTPSWMMVVWMVPAGIGHQALTYFHRDRSMSIFRGPDQLRRENEIGNVNIIASLLGGGVAAMLPISDLWTITALAVVLYCIDLFIVYFLVHETHRYMEKYEVVLCSMEPKEEEETR